MPFLKVFGVVNELRDCWGYPTTKTDFTLISASVLISF